MASSMICGAALAGLAVSPAAAQTASGANANSAAVSEVVVTGTRIPTPNLTSVSPVAVVNREEIKSQGVTRIEDLINNLPQVAASFGGNVSNGATGAANIDLRNLGRVRTLVLIDGRRLLPGDPTQNGAESPDVNFIPAALVERFDILTGGASATYGADAVAGVVNFILLKNFEGVRLDASTSFYQHDQHSDVSQALISGRAATNPTEFKLPSKNVTDGSATDITLVMGVNSPEGKGNITAYAEYRHLDPLLQSERDFSACSFNLVGGNFACGGSGTNATGQFQVYTDPNLSKRLAILTVDRAAGNAFRPFTTADQFNFAPYNYFQRPDERYSLGFMGHYELSKQLDVYSQMMFMDDHSVAQIAPSGVFGEQESISCSNPFLSASEVQALCVTGRTAPVQNADIVLLRRNVEGGGRQADLRHTDYRMVIGLRGDLGDDWKYDAYAQYGTAIYAQEYKNEFSLARTALALDAVRDPATGQIVCRAFLTGQDTNCVPYNPFQIGAVTPAMLNYIQVPGFQQGSTTETVVSGSITGNLGQYGIKSPWATDGAGVAGGAEYRRESSDLRVDTEFATGDLAGQGGATLPTSGSYDVYELFAEARLPLIQDMPFVKDLTLETGYRYSDYNLGFKTNTYKFAGDWRPIDDLRFRASYQRAVRAPNIQELFRPQVVQLDGTTDPCAGPTPSLNGVALTPAQCALTGVSAGQFGTILANPAGQYNGRTGGNPNLNPEIADTYSAGAVFTPGFLPGFTASVDWFNIKITKVVGTIGADLILERCLTSGVFCSDIHRAPGTGSLWIGNAGFIDDTNFNLGSLSTRGVDFEGTYRTDLAAVGLPDYGGLSFNMLATWTQKLLTETLPGDPKFDCAGWYGTTCGVPQPKWRSRFRATWSTPWKVQATLTWRYLSSVRLGTSLSPAAASVVSTLPSENYFDLSGSWQVRDNLTFRVGVNNIFDKDPPLVTSGNSCPAVFCSGNTFPQVYDALGRYVFFNITSDF